MEKANAEVRKELKDKGIPYWKLGKQMGVSEQTVVRWLRTPLTNEQSARIQFAIHVLSET